MNSWRKKARVRVQLRLDELAPNCRHLVPRRKAIKLSEEEDDEALRE